MLHNCQSIMKYLIYLGIIVAAILVGIGIASEIPSRQFTIIPEEEPIKIEKEMVGHRVITAYSSCPEETDDTPFITAYNTKVRDGIVATNEFPKGTKLLIENRIYVVEDKTNSRYSYLIDIWMPSKQEAIEWGRQILEVSIIVDDID